MPTSVSEMYIFPDYNFNYSFNKLNLYTSYDGDLSYFNIVESSNRNFQDTRGTTEIMSDQVVRQNIGHIDFIMDSIIYSTKRTNLAFILFTIHIQANIVETLICM